MKGLMTPAQLLLRCWTRLWLGISCEKKKTKIVSWAAACQKKNTTHSVVLCSWIGLGWAGLWLKKTKQKQKPKAAIEPQCTVSNTFFFPIAETQPGLTTRSGTPHQQWEDSNFQLDTHTSRCLIIQQLGLGLGLVWDACILPENGKQSQSCWGCLLPIKESCRMVKKGRDEREDKQVGGAGASRLPYWSSGMGGTKMAWIGVYTHVTTCDSQLTMAIGIAVTKAMQSYDLSLYVLVIMIQAKCSKLRLLKVSLNNLRCYLT